MDVDAAIGSLLPILGDPDLGILPAVEVGGSAPSVGAGETKEKPRPSRKNDTAKGPTPASRANASEAGTSRPYLQQNPYTRQESQRKLEKHLNAAAHTPEFKPGAYKAPKLSDDALHLLADFIRRPAIRNQLIPLVGELPDRKRRKTKAEKKEVKIVVSEETGRRLKTRLSAQQTASLEERYKEKAQWRPTECEKLLEGLNALGPELSTEQVSRWFDNKRRYVKKQQARARDSATADEGNDEVHAEEKRKTKVERRVRHSEREMLEAAFAQNSAPGISVRTALATAIGISEKQVTAWFTRRQQTGRAPYGVSASVEDVENRSSKRANTAGSDAVIAGHLLGSLGASGHPLMMQQQGDFNPEAGLNPGVLSALGVPVGGDGRAQAGNGLTGVWGW